jgi:hypothetical protein
MTIPPERLGRLARALVHAEQVVSDLKCELSATIEDGVPIVVTHDGSARTPETAHSPAACDDEPPSTPVA